MIHHEFHVGGFVRQDAPVPVLLSRGCAGLAAAHVRVARPHAQSEGWGGDIKREGLGG